MTLSVNPCRRLAAAVRGLQHFKAAPGCQPARRRLQAAGTGSRAEIASLRGSFDLSRLIGLALLGGGLALRSVMAADGQVIEPLRRPVALARIGSTLFVANRDAGSLTLVDIAQLSLREEIPIGRRPVDLAVAGHQLLVIDESEAQLRVLSFDQEKLRTMQLLPLPTAPVCLAVSSDGQHAVASSLWARQITLLRRGTDSIWTRRHTVDLPFAPRRLWLTPTADRVVVADAFGGNLAVVDSERGVLLARRTHESHNISGLTSSADGRMVMVSAQLLNPLVATERDRVFWGTVLGNSLRALHLDDLLQPWPASLAAPLPVRRWQLFPVGQARRAAGDPGAIWITSGGLHLICLAGVDEVGLSRDLAADLTRIRVGRRPVAVNVNAGETTAYIANQFDDTLSVLDLATGTVTATISLGRKASPTLAQRGESLFHDARVSLDGWMSCHSCHTDGHTNNQLNDNLDDDSAGTPKRVLSLLGVVDTAPWTWRGLQASLVAQTRTSVTRTMQGAHGLTTTDADLEALAEFLRTLRPPPGLAVARQRVEAAGRSRGELRFNQLGCADCHAPPTYSAPRTFDVGLRDEQGNVAFNPPSLRGISQRDRFFHDGRAANLAEVFGKFGHPEGQPLAPADLRDLLAFLESL